MGGMGNMGKLLKQAQKMQADVARAQEEANALEAEASVGGGAVKAKVNGKLELISLKISPEAVDPNDVEMLEDLVTAAVNQAVKEVRERSEAIMSQATAGMAGMMPPGMGF
jgi:DNA-binding YbaB/EbfC family protein